MKSKGCTEKPLELQTPSLVTFSSKSTDAFKRNATALMALCLWPSNRHADTDMVSRPAARG